MVLIAVVLQHLRCIYVMSDDQMVNVGQVIALLQLYNFLLFVVLSYSASVLLP